MQSAEQLETLMTTSNNDDLKKLSVDFLEVGIDQFLDGVAKEVPLVKTIVETFTAVQAHYFLKKLLAFTNEISQVQMDERQKIINRINNSEKYRSSVGETLLENLDKVESDYKPQIIGKMFVAVIDEIISYQEFLKATHLVSKLFYWDLVQLKENTDSSDYVLISISDEIDTSGLTTTDFVKTINDVYEGNDNSTSNTCLTPIGKIIINIGLAEN